MSKVPPLITSAQVAERFGVKPETVTRWAKNERLPYAHKLEGLRGAYLFDPREVEKFAKARSAA